MFDWLGNEAWLAWGVGLLIGFPLLMVLFGEMLYRLEDTKTAATLSLPMPSILFFQV